ncbi:MAG: hypothetical protein WBQ55_26755 [Xanthobacteraceae bacterium]
MVDTGMDRTFVEADGKPRLCPRRAHISENSLDAVEIRNRDGAAVISEHFPRQFAVGEALADIGLLIGRAGDERARAVEQQDRSAGMLGGRREIADPLQIDHRHHDATERAVILDDRIARDDARHIVGAADHVIAERKFARGHHALKVRSVRHIESEGERLSGALDAAVVAGDREVADPRNVRHQIG